MKFVILSEKGKNYQVYFHEALKRSDVLYSDYYLSDTTLFDKFLQKLHGTKKIPMGIKKMFHFLWTIRFHLLKLNKFIKNEDCIILVYRSWYALFEEGLDKYLKNININKYKLTQKYKVIYVKCNLRHGVDRAHMDAISKCSCDYFMWLDSGDYLSNNFFEKTLKLF